MRDVAQLKEFLDEKVDLYNRPGFIEYDPIQIPHSFKKQQDIEISAFFAATLAWGQRKTIISRRADANAVPPHWLQRHC